MGRYETPLRRIRTVTRPASAMAQAPDLYLEQRMLLRCSAAFALVVHKQAAGDAAAQQYPDLSDRGREFFIRASAQVMDETGLSRDVLAQALRIEAQDLTTTDAVDQVMPVCLTILPSILPPE